MAYSFSSPYRLNSVLLAESSSAAPPWPSLTPVTRTSSATSKLKPCNECNFFGVGSKGILGLS